MTRAELIKLMSEQTGIGRKETESMLRAFTSIVAETVTNGEDVDVSGFGKFVRRERKGQSVRVPTTGEIVKTEDKKIIGFKPAKKLRDKVSGNGE